MEVKDKRNWKTPDAQRRHLYASSDQSGVTTSSAVEFLPVILSAIAGVTMAFDTEKPPFAIIGGAIFFASVVLAGFFGYVRRRATRVNEAKSTIDQFEQSIVENAAAIIEGQRIATKNKISLAVGEAPAFENRHTRKHRRYALRKALDRRAAVVAKDAIDVTELPQAVTVVEIDNVTQEATLFYGGLLAGILGGIVGIGGALSGHYSALLGGSIVSSIGFVILACALISAESAGESA